MKTITFITSNAVKLAEVKAILGENSYFNLVHHALDLPEIQSTATEIATQKCKTAAAVVRGPVLVEDTGLAYKSLNGLPGPYVKIFMSTIGLEGLIRILADYEDKSAQAICTFAYTEGPNEKVHLFTGITKGTIVSPPEVSKVKQTTDNIFRPEGYDRSYGQMPADEKNTISHRFKALMQLKEFFAQNAVT